MICCSMAPGGIATVTLNSPENRNALSAELLEVLHAKLTELNADTEVRALVLTGAGPAFCAGADLRGGPRRPGASGLAEVLMLLWQLEIPTICRVNGAARGGGLGLVAACDFRIAPAEVTFGFSEVRLGVVPAMISPFVLRRIAPSDAVELFTTGRMFSADEARELGLISQVVPADSLDAAVQSVVAALSMGGPLAVRAAKALVRDAMEPIDPDRLRQLAELSRDYFASDEAAEGIAARREKRRPSWAPAEDEVSREV